VAKPVKPRKRRLSKNAQRKRITETSAKPRCRVAILGIGGAGNNIVNRLMENGVAGAECVAVNTDLKDLNSVNAARKVLIGEKVACGLGARGNPEIGRTAVEESRLLIESLLENLNVVFLVVGLGGGTGTGATPTVAKIARRKGAVVVGVVTTPFRSEKNRVETAAHALNEMRSACDTVVVIDNNKIVESFSKFPTTEAFKLSDHVLANIIKSLVETILEPGLINMDFANFKTIVKKGGIAAIGFGESNAPNRAEEAVRNALKTPLLDIDTTGATGALIHISGDPKLTVNEANSVGEIATEMIGHNASIVWGARTNPQTEGGLKVTVVLTGLNSPHKPWGFETIIPELYNIESPYSEPEKSLQIDLGLDQIENFED